MKIGPDALGVAQNESESAKHEDGTRRPLYRPKHVRERKTCQRDQTYSQPSKMSPEAQNMKMGPDALGTVENESGITKLQNGTRHARYRPKRIR
jgi:hypothetical protein